MLLKVGPLVLLAALTAAAADAPQTRKADGGKVWELGFATGTADEIGRKLNSEVVRLRAATATLADQEKKLLGGLPASEARVLDAVRKTPAYVAAKAEMDAAEAALKAARASGTSREKLDASGKFNTVRLSLADMEKRALKADATVPEQRAALAKAQAQLASTRASLAKAEEWRREIVGRIDNHFLLNWPLRTGDEGTLRACEVLDATQPDGVIVLAPVYRQTGDVEKAEVGVNIRVVTEKVLVQVRGVDARRLAKGATWSSSRVFKIDQSVELRGGQTAYVVSPSDGELQALLDEVHKP
jgi:multidrug efflux pump subunit AcrA (membrane-fusion protein)